MSAEAWNILIEVAGLISKSAREIYAQILESGSIPVKADTPKSKMEAIYALEKYGFVYRQNIFDGYVTFPTPLPILAISLLYRIDWAYPPFTKIPSEVSANIRTALINIAVQGGVEPQSYHEISSTRSVEGSSIDVLVAQVLPNTQKFFAISAAEWSANLPLVWTVLVQRLKEGMQYLRVVSPLEFVAFGWRINKRDVEEIGVNLRVITKTLLSPFYLFMGNDFMSALVFTPLQQREAIPRATYVMLKPLVQRSEEMFYALWQTAKPAYSVLHFLEAYRVEYLSTALSACGKKGMIVAEKIFDMGIFSELFPEDNLSVDCLVKASLIFETRHKIGLHTYAPNIVQKVSLYVQQGG